MSIQVWRVDRVRGEQLILTPAAPGLQASVNKELPEQHSAGPSLAEKRRPKRTNRAFKQDLNLQYKNLQSVGDSVTGRGEFWALGKI